MEADGAQGLVWSLTIIVMPILLGLAIAFGAYQTWKRRKAGAPVRREPGRIDNVDPNPDETALVFVPLRGEQPDGVRQGGRS